MASQQIEISIVVPVYNSAHTLVEFVSRVQQAMNANGLSYELILTDDHSNDESWSVIRAICGDKSNVIGLHLARNYGQWAACLAGMGRASGKYIVTIDDDLEYQPADIPVLYSNIKEGGYDVVFGMNEKKYVMQEKSRIVAVWRNRWLDWIWNKIPTDSFKILKRELVYEGEKFIPTVSLEAFIAHKKPSVKVGYSEVSFNKRFAGQSNHTLLKKMGLFMQFSAQFSRRIVLYFILTLALILLIGTSYLLGITPGSVGLSMLFFLSVFLAFYYLALVVIKNGLPVFFEISESLNAK